MSINFHLSDEIGRIFWVNTKKVIETDPDNKTIKWEWVFAATDSDIVNVASEYVTGRGLYVSQWTVDSDDNAQGKLARISDAGTDVASSLSTYLTLSFSQNYSSECSGTVSVHTDSGTGQDMITLSYNYKNSNFESYDNDDYYEYLIDIFSLVLSHAGSLTFNRRVTIASQEGQHLESIGSYTIDSNSAYLVVQD